MRQRPDLLVRMTKSRCGGVLQHPANGEAIALDISRAGGECVFIRADLAVKEECRALVEGLRSGSDP